MYPNVVAPHSSSSLPYVQDCSCFPEVYHVQRRAMVNGQLHLRNGCAVLEEQLQLEGAVSPIVVYTPVYCLGTAQQLFALEQSIRRALRRERALYTVRQGEALLIYTPHRKHVFAWKKQAWLPVYSHDQEAMFQLASERLRLGFALPQGSSRSISGTYEETIKLARIPGCTLHC